MERETFLRMNDNGGGELLHTGMIGSLPPSRSVPIKSPPSVTGGMNYILHTVSKFDTLAGVAIKYGVEVADIKRLNGLVTDLQMFALKTLQIPLPGRHAPSPGLSNGHDTPRRPSSSQQNVSSRRRSDLFDSFPSLKLKSSSDQKVSLAMSSLQGYYGLRPADQKDAGEGFEMAVYRKGGACYLEDAFAQSSPISNPPLSRHRKSRSIANCLMSENGELDQVLSEEAESSESDKWIEKLVRRHQKSEVDFTVRNPEKLLKENTSSNSISAITGKGLALRPKSASRAVTGVNGESGLLNTIPIGLGDAFPSNSINGVRKSSSATSLQDSDNGTLSSIWLTSKWSLKPDFQALSTAAITRPIFDGLAKPSNRRNKTALD